MGDKTAVAHHEAGHAIVAHVLGYAVCKIVLVDDGDDSEGFITIIPNADESENRIVELYAGREADLHFGSSKEEADGGAKGDLKTIKNIARKLGISRECKLKLRQRAADLVEHHWAGICSLATELQQHEQLDRGSGLRELLVGLTKQPCRGGTLI